MPQITVTTDDVVNAGNKINSLSEQINDLIGQCRNTAESVREAWTGNAANAFGDAMTQWNHAANSIQKAASDIGIATRTSGTNYADAETTNTSMFK